MANQDNNRNQNMDQDRSQPNQVREQQNQRSGGMNQPGKTQQPGGKHIDQDKKDSSFSADE